MIQNRFNSWLKDAENFEDQWRKDNELNFDYYDGNQWTEEEEAIIKSRGQQPTVMNMIRPTVDMCLSVEQEKRTDIQVVGRTPDSSEIGDSLTALIKQVRDVSVADYYESQAFREGIIGGRGVLFVDIEREVDEEGVIVPGQIFERWIPWEEVYFDPHHRLPDATDARFIIRKVWLDIDSAKKRYKDKAEEIQNNYNDSFHGIEEEAQMYAPNRGKDPEYYRPGRVCVCHCWYKDVDNRVRYVEFAGDVCLRGSFDNDSENDTPNGVDVYPIVPFYAFRTRKGRPQGLVRLIRDYQDTINKVNSKYIWNLSCNRIQVETDAVDTARNSYDELSDQWSRPDGIIFLNNGGLQKIRTEENLRELQYLSNHIQMLINLMQRTSGINDSMNGIGGQNERSAMQQQNRILQGAAMQTSILENLHFSKLQTTKVILKLLAKFYSDKPIYARILKPSGETEFTALNQQSYDEHGNLQGVFNQINDVLNYDVVLRRVAPFSTTRERMVNMCVELGKTGVLPPEFIGEMVLNFGDIPNANELRRLMSEINERNRGMQEAQGVAGIAKTLQG